MKHYLLTIWSIIDPIYYFFTRLHYVIDEHQEKTIFRVRLTRYKGSPVKLQDGTMIYKNDLLLKIHLHNVKILKELYDVKNDLKRAVIMYHSVKRALPRLADYIHDHYRQQDIKAILGITSLFRSADRLGFEVIPIQNKLYRFYKKNSFLFIDLFAHHKDRQEPTYLFMSKRHLIQTHMLKNDRKSKIIK